MPSSPRIQRRGGGDNSNSRQGPLLYRIAGLWAITRARMLLWISILSVYGAASRPSGQSAGAAAARVLAVQAAIALGFLAFHPLRLPTLHRLFPAPATGPKTQSILQDPASPSIRPCS